MIRIQISAALLAFAVLPAGAALPASLGEALVPEIGGLRQVHQSHSGSTLTGLLLVDGHVGGTVAPGRPSDWTFTFADSRTGRAVTDFEPEHEKYLHLVVVSDDLRTFAHVHPAYDRKTGRFTVRVNQATADPDNQDLARAVPKPGRYFLFAELKPRGQSVQRVLLTAAALGQPDRVATLPDRRDATGKIVKYFTQTGEPGAAGDAYRVSYAVDKESMPGMVHLTFRIEAAMRHGDHAMYHEVTDLVPWLGMMGHAIVLGRTGDRIEEKIFLHLHAGHHDHPHDDHGHGGHGHPPHGSAGPDVAFMLMGDDIPASGVYKIWAQVKRGGRVLTFPFVFEFAR
ncbi:MAG: hypothetical protein HY078_02145 [Elusimicrobia bacterium]|nr:hypothetical protein [Elusimicrobiota bacterium]